jgi:hypothetical protein
MTAEPQSGLAGLGDAEAHMDRARTFTCLICGQGYTFADHHACLDRLGPRPEHVADYHRTAWRAAPRRTR